DVFINDDFAARRSPSLTDPFAEEILPPAPQSPSPFPIIPPNPPGVINPDVVDPLPFFPPLSNQSSPVVGPAPISRADDDIREDFFQPPARSPVPRKSVDPPSIPENYNPVTDDSGAVSIVRPSSRPAPGAVPAPGIPRDLVRPEPLRTGIDLVPPP